MYKRPFFSVETGTFGERQGIRSFPFAEPREEKMPTGPLYREITVVEETVQILADPERHGVSTTALFKLLNASTQVSNNHSVHSKMIDLPNLISLGQLLAEQRNLVYEDPQQALSIAQFVYSTLSTHVYINHVDTNNVNDTSGIGEVVNTNSNWLYSPDLRLAIKNVLVLFVSFMNRYIEPMSTASGSEMSALKTTITNLIMLFNISIISKLHNLFRSINPDLKLQYDAINDLFIENV